MTLDDLIQEFEEMKNNPDKHTDGEEFARVGFYLHQENRPDLGTEAYFLAWNRDLKTPNIYHNIGYLELTENKDLEKAIVIWTEAMEKSTYTSSTAYLLSVVQAQEKNDLDKAIKVLEQAREQDGVETDGYNYLLKLYETTESHEKIIPMLEEAVEREEADVDLYIEFMGKLIKVDLDKSIAVGKEAIEKGLANGYTYAILGNLLEEKKQDEEAFTLFKQAEEKGLVNDLFYNTWGHMHLANDEIEAGREIFERAVKKELTNPQLLENLAEANIKLGDKKVGLDVYMTAYEQGKLTPRGFEQLARGAFEEDDFEKMVHFFNTARENNLTNPGLYEAMGSMLANKQKDYETARTILQEGLEKEPDKKLYGFLAGVNFMTGREEEALELLEEAEAKGMLDISDNTLVGLAKFKAKEYEQAKIAFEQASTKKEFDDIIYEYYIKSLVHVGEQDKAIQVSIEADDKGRLSESMKSLLSWGVPNHPRAKQYLEEARENHNLKDFTEYHTLAEIYHKEGLFNEAIEVIEESNQIGALDEWALKESMKTKLLDAYEQLANKDVNAVKKKWDNEEELSSAEYYQLIEHYRTNKEYVKLLEISEQAKSKAVSGMLEDIVDERLVEAYEEVNGKEDATAFMENLKKEGTISSPLLLALTWQYMKSLDDKEKAKETCEYAIKNDLITPETLFINAQISEKEEDALLIEEQFDKKMPTIAYYLAELAEKGIIKKSTKEDYLKGMVDDLKKNNAFEGLLETKRKAAHIISTIPTSMISSKELLIVKEDNKPFDEEILYHGKVKEALAEEKRVNLPHILDHFQHNDKHYLLMTHEKGISYTEMANGKVHEDTDSKEFFRTTHAYNVHEEDLYYPQLSILKIISQLYRSLPAEELEKYDFIGKMRDNNYTDEDIHSAAYMLYLLDKSPHYFYYNDSRSDNWLMSSKITLLDTENRGRAPLAMDIAQALHYIPQIPFEETLELMPWVMDNVNKKGPDMKNVPIESLSQLNLEYAAGTIYRSLLNSRMKGEQDDPWLAYMINQTGLDAIKWIETKKESPLFEIEGFGERLENLKELITTDANKWHKESGPTMQRMIDTWGDLYKHQKSMRQVFPFIQEELHKKLGAGL